MGETWFFRRTLKFLLLSNVFSGLGPTPSPWWFNFVHCQGSGDSGDRGSDIGDSASDSTSDSACKCSGDSGDMVTMMTVVAVTVNSAQSCLCWRITLLNYRIYPKGQDRRQKTWCVPRFSVLSGQKQRTSSQLNSSLVSTARIVTKK
jgi:hypothetical protein